MYYCFHFFLKLNSTRSVEAGIPTQSVGTRRIHSDKPAQQKYILVPTLCVGMPVATLRVAC
ncbi:hypothetical protein THIOM_005311 [Candidatus Thiomargarita nelsonii]|uniref:Uncharacterized protein n=1 Tax=Candidatus Thiomargarita nelsonii TaxID=1003181 RepID=A0A176RTK8_9GAMM|nr:hypothetical protein THIOM_005311 [Candidatus Thiomargarita nelsonii]